jgi:arylformamidase
VRLVYLSWPLDGRTPAYGGGESLAVEPVRSIERGDTANAARWTLSNHLGTHIDLPRHFVAGGRCLDDYPPHFFEFTRIGVARVGPVAPTAAIGPDTLDIPGIPSDFELLLVVTGFSRLRDEPVYWERGPVFLPEIADFIRGRFPDVRAFGFDTISLSSWTDRETGRQAHRAFLEHERPIPIIEDMDLSPLEPGITPARLIVSPLRVSGADAAPVTITAWVQP